MKETIKELIKDQGFLDNVQEPDKVMDAFEDLIDNSSDITISEDNLEKFIEGNLVEFSQNVLIDTLLEYSGKESIEKLLEDVDGDTDKVIEWYNGKVIISKIKNMMERASSIFTFSTVFFCALEKNKDSIKKQKNSFDVEKYYSDILSELRDENEAFMKSSNMFIKGKWKSATDVYDITHTNNPPYMNNRVMLIGQAGAGKTWLLKKMQYEICNDPENNLNLIPIYIELKDYNNTNFTPEGNVTILQHMIQEKLRIEAEELVKIAGRCVLLLDGVDEIREIEFKSDVKHFINTRIGKKMKVIITSRKNESTFGSSLEWMIYQAVPFDEELIKAYFESYVDTQKQKNIEEALLNGKLAWFKEINVYPLMIQALVENYNQYGEEAFNQDQFDDRYLKYLLLREYDKHGEVDANNLNRVMITIATHVDRDILINMGFDLPFLDTTFKDFSLTNTNKGVLDYITVALYIPIIVRQEDGFYKFENSNYIDFFRGPNFQPNGELL